MPNKPKEVEPHSLVQTAAERMVAFLAGSPARARWFLGFVLALIAYALYTLIF